MYRALNGTVPIGLVASDWGGQEIQVFMSPGALNDTTCGGTRAVPSAPSGPASSGAHVTTARGTAQATVSGSGGGGAAHHRTSGGVRGDGVTASQLWFAMLAPLARMRFAGTVWYQGEDNCWAPHQYSCLFPAMIADWRIKFQLPEMSFFFVQLAPYWSVCEIRKPLLPRICSRTLAGLLRPPPSKGRGGTRQPAGGFVMRQTAPLCFC